MRKSAWMLAAISVSVATPATAQGITLVRGEEAMLEIDNDGLADAARGPATPTAFELAVGRQFSGQKPPEAPLAQGTPIHNGTGLPDAPVPDPGRLRFRFFQVPGTDHSMLIVHNGYRQGLLYRARITANGKTAPTDVCLVMPGKSGVEHWPYAISAIEVSAFELVDWKAGDGAPCK